MIQSQCIKPIKKKILVRKCLAYTPEVHEGRVYWRSDNVVVTDVRGSYTHWAEILDVADDCKLFDKSCVGAFVYLPEWSPQKMTRVGRILDNGVPVDDFVVKESLFLEDNGAKPIIARE